MAKYAKEVKKMSVVQIVKYLFHYERFKLNTIRNREVEKQRVWITWSLQNNKRFIDDDKKHITRRKEAKINILTTYHADDNISVIIKALGIDM